MRKFAYKQLIANLVKIAFNLKETILKPMGDLVELYVKNEPTGQNLLIGKIKIEPDFVSFIEDGQYTTKVLPLSRVDEYMRMRSFKIDDTPENGEALKKINANFDMAKTVNKDQVIPYLTQRRPQDDIYTASFVRKELGLEIHDKTLKQYTDWLGRKSPAQAPQLNPKPQR